ncbi:MAG: hypothetical protein OXU66_13460 [Gammaproteobacteria bacterium]|nr:hypothetical protein [Gammaproteobacteria bacterium]MDD9895798.1 hypothetical protein [Gammaproteobacteria bacterium]MDD9959929.1 hypothetical protein [Gammaproteobacteria bacterium]
MDLESRGLPSGFVASCEFEQAADAQGKSLGIKPARVFVPHPIQDRTDEEMTEIAKAAINEVTALILNH